MKKIFFSLIIISFLSCESESLKEDSISVESYSSKMKVFDSWVEFSETMQSLLKFQSDEEFLDWLSEQDYNSYYNIAFDPKSTELETTDNLSIELLAIFNESLKFKVGNEIINFKNNEFYSTNLLNNEEELSTNIQIIEFSEDGETIDKSLSDRTYLSTGETGRSYKDFTRQAYRKCSNNSLVLGKSSRPMRFYQQLKGLYFSGTMALYVETKLFFRNSKNDLSYAEKEERTYTYDIHGTVGINGGLYSNYQEVPININATVSCTRSKWNRFLIADTFTNGPKQWNINLNGTITHYINGDASYNKWYANCNW
ncbi:hypothetical protein JM658_06990 [Joostella atrarenae]|uniref:Uncharacterized protein n=1 Tax=Joostella atrarenae TaxID=679257 RepID=A0ABS9J2D8_9FLAO|nr:hypothetical protein [Joostella atrarenae]MCF8714575.1 hypothetical protein [Joostella atrarenae]